MTNNPDLIPPEPFSEEELTRLSKITPAVVADALADAKRFDQDLYDLLKADVEAEPKKKKPRPRKRLR